MRERLRRHGLVRALVLLMAITFFGVASAPADNGAQAGATVAVTPPGSMVAGDLVVMVAQIRADVRLQLSEQGGQRWSSYRQPADSTTVKARVFFCRYTGTWSADPSVTNPEGDTTNPMTVVMLVFRPSSGSKFWVPDVMQIAGTFVAGSSPFTKTITGLTTIKADTVSLAGWFTADLNTWGALAGTGWVKTSLSAQYRNTTGLGQSATFAYQIKTAAGATNDVSQDQLTLGGDPGATAIMAFAEIDLPTGANAGRPSPPRQVALSESQTGGTSIACSFAAAVGSGHAVIGAVNWESFERLVFPLTDNQGNEYTPIQVVSSLVFDQYLLTFFRPNITNAPLTVTATFDAASIALGLMLHEVPGITALDVYAANEHNVIDDLNPEVISAGVVTTTADRDYVFGAAILPGSNLDIPWFDFRGWGTVRREVGNDSPLIQTHASGDAIKTPAGLLDVNARMKLGQNALIAMAAFTTSALAVVDYTRYPRQKP